MTKLLVVIAVVACSKSDDKTPTAADPWGSPPAAADPWSTPTVAEPAQPAPAPGASAPPASDLTAVAGTYQCQTLRNGTLVNGLYQTAYMPSALGRFEIDADGGYRSPSYPAQGNGRARADAATITFEDGPYAGYIGRLGANTSGAYIHFGAKSSEPPPSSMHFNDHVCYRR